MADTFTRSPTVAPRWPWSRCLWTLVAGVGLFGITIAIANAFVSPSRAITLDSFGQDFMAFYSAGQFAWRGHGQGMYDLRSLAQAQAAIAADASYAQAAPIAPWWNPPHFALPFAPLSAVMGFRVALACWTLFGVMCLAAAGWILSRIILEVSPRRRDRWLVIAAVAIAPPTLQALGHGQNTPLSLLLLACLVTAWRARHPIAAGIACAMLAYKPQLAAIVAIGLLASLGWRVVIGLMLGAIPPLIATLTLLPGSIDSFLDRVPENLRTIQVGQEYLWHRHATLPAFFRHVLQGNAAGETHGWIQSISLLAIALVAMSLVAVRFSLNARLHDAGESGRVALDRLIVAVILATPLLAPFYFDYDLLLLLVAGVLVGREQLDVPPRSLPDRAIRPLGAIVYVWLLINPSLAELRGINLTVPLLLAIYTTHVYRCTRAAVDRAPEASENVETIAPIKIQPPRIAA